MALKQFIYPLDLSGTRTSNRVTELHTIGVDRYRAFALKTGPFYTKDLVVRENGKTTPLKRGLDYECVFYYENIGRMTAGLEVCGVIVVHNTNIGTDLSVEVNIVGGPYAASAEAIQDAINQLELDNRNVYWANVIQKPDLFQPTPHLHDLGDIFGFEFIIDLLGAIRDAILVGDNAKMEQLRDHLDEIVRQFNQSLQTHLNDKSNPHKVTSDQVNAYSKEAIDQMVLLINQALSQHASRMDGIDQDINQLARDLQAFVDALTAYNQRVSVVEGKQSRLSSDIAAINDAIQAINEDLTRVWAEINALKETDIAHQQAINKNAQDIALIKQKDAQQDQRLNALEQENATQQQQIDAVTDKANSLQDNMKDYVKKSEVYGDVNDHTQEEMIGRIPRIRPNGALEICHVIDFHIAGSQKDWDIREEARMNTSINALEIYNTERYNAIDVFIRSDLRDKNDVEALSGERAHQILTDIGGGITYRLLEETARTAGLAAQEVQKVMPEAIVVGENNEGEERLSVRNNAIIAALVSGYNYQQERIETLEQLLKDILNKKE
jgi:hypothetical protein